MKPDSRIYVAGHTGMVGSAIVRRLTALGFRLGMAYRHDELDLRDQGAVEDLFFEHQPTHVFLAAALVGGIGANMKSPGDFISRNLEIQQNVISAAHGSGVKKLVFLGSSCIYPRIAPQPIKEDALLSGPLEETSRAYAVAKIAGIETLRAYRQQYGFQSVSVMPCNLYGPGDNFDPSTSHVVPGMMRRMHEAKMRGDAEVTLWGTGTPRRELMYVDDCAAACVEAMLGDGKDPIVNVGTGEDLTIHELAEMVAVAVEYNGSIRWDASRPDGTPRKLLDVSRARDLGWLGYPPSTTLGQGLQQTYRWFIEHQETP